jgi:hypothetical protein
MEARKPRHIKPGHEYDTLFPFPNKNNKTIRRNANVDHTVAFIPNVVKDTLQHTAGIARRLKGSSVYDSCKNIWHFVYGHINYKKDQEGYEQIRSPARAWYDRRSGVDCDCYSVFISSILTNLNIPHILRITKYARKYFQHIYPVVPHGSRQITLDCVTDYFDYEVPYSEKKDYPMDLQYLDGFDGLDGQALGLFGKKKKKKAAAAAAATATATSAALPGSPAPVPAAPKPKKKGFFKKVLNVVNKVNPATVLLRNGVLAALKLNIKNVAKRLRWSYLAPDKIAQHGIDPAKYQKLVSTRQKLENIFYGAGGNPNNFRKAILNGKGNKDKAVSGLGMLPMQEWSSSMSEYSTLGELLGDEIYYSENIEGMEGFGGFGELGEPISLASIGAAMGVIAGIVSALKQIGNIFKGKEKGGEDFNEALTEDPENNVNASAAAAAAAEATAAASTAPVSASNLPTIPDNSSSSYEDNGGQSYTPSQQNAGSGDSDYEEEYYPPSAALNKTSSLSTNTNNSDKTGFWDKNKKWIKPVAIGVGGITLIAIGFKLMKGIKGATKSGSRSASLSGVSRKRKKKTKSSSKSRGRKKAIALF